MKLTITILSVLIVQFVVKDGSNISKLNASLSKTDSASYSVSELKDKYAQKGFELISSANHKYKSQNNYLFVFEKKVQSTNVNQNRDLIICKKIGSDRFKIIAVNKKAIYSKLSSIQCDEIGDSFSKIVTRNSFITLEQTACGKNSLIKEFFTFKLNKEDKYLLDKYSIVVQQRLGPDDDDNYVLDEYPVETITKDDFGNISLDVFKPELLNPFRKKFPEHIYELFK